MAVVAGTFSWDDIGSWDALLRIRPPDARGNVTVGRVTLGDDVQRSVIWAENEHLVVSGVSDMVVVRANGHTLYTIDVWCEDERGTKLVDGDARVEVAPD